MIYALITCGWMSMLFPEVASSASTSFRRSGKSRAPAVHSQRRFTSRFGSGSGVVVGPVQGPHRFKDRFDRPGFKSRFGDDVRFAAHVIDLGDIFIIQVPPSAPALSPSREPAHTGTYVYPQWLDGGHGVEISRPGYWSAEKQPAERYERLGSSLVS